MFEDEDCSIAEAKLRAAILGKSYDECKKDWELQFKKEFVLANANILLKYNYVADQIGKFNFVMAIHYYDDLLTNKIMKCNGISCDRIREGAFLLSTCNLTISFYDFELDAEFMKQVKEKIRKYTEP